VIRQSAEVARDYPDRVSLSGLSADVLTESRRLEHLVDALLLLARLDEGVVLGTEDVDVDDLVLSAVAGVGPLRGGLGLDLTHVSSGQVHGNPILLAQVVRNLVDNALRHARSEVAVSLREWQGRVELYVDDDGDGIPPEERDRVFDRFVRLDEGRARDEGGSGLGLAIVRRIVELHDGTVSLGASPLGGARCSVVLPASV
jgi:signal transduction histidine kinase